MTESMLTFYRYTFTCVPCMIVRIEWEIFHNAFVPRLAFVFTKEVNDEDDDKDETNTAHGD